MELEDFALDELLEKLDVELDVMLEELLVAGVLDELLLIAVTLELLVATELELDAELVATGDELVAVGGDSCFFEDPPPQPVRVILNIKSVPGIKRCLECVSSFMIPSDG